MFNLDFTPPPVPQSIVARTGSRQHKYETNPIALHCCLSFSVDALLICEQTDKSFCGCTKNLATKFFFGLLQAPPPSPKGNVESKTSAKPTVNPIIFQHCLEGGGGGTNIALRGGRVAG